MKREVIPGKRYGNWTVLYFHGYDWVRRPMWMCLCHCTVVRPVRAQDLLRDDDRHASRQCMSCGARQREAKKREERGKTNV